jgi:hypothetical protein
MWNTFALANTFATVSVVILTFLAVLPLFIIAVHLYQLAANSRAFTLSAKRMHEPSKKRLGLQLVSGASSGQGDSGLTSTQQNRLTGPKNS